MNGEVSYQAEPIFLKIPILQASEQKVEISDGGIIAENSVKFSKYSSSASRAPPKT